jgi:serine/threonine-protein kinase RIO1
MAKAFVGLQETGREVVLAIVKASTEPMTVSQIAKQITDDKLKGLSKKDLRQFTQNVVDRLYRHEQLVISKGAKKTGREVNVYALAPESTATVAAPAAAKPAKAPRKRASKVTKVETTEVAPAADTTVTE